MTARTTRHRWITTGALITLAATRQSGLSTPDSWTPTALLLGVVYLTLAHTRRQSRTSAFLHTLALTTVAAVLQPSTPEMATISASWVWSTLATAAHPPEEATGSELCRRHDQTDDVHVPPALLPFVSSFLAVTAAAFLLAHAAFANLPTSYFTAVTLATVTAFAIPALRSPDLTRPLSNHVARIALGLVVAGSSLTLIFPGWQPPAWLLILAAFTLVGAGPAVLDHAAELHDDPAWPG